MFALSPHTHTHTHTHREITMFRLRSGRTSLFLILVFPAPRLSHFHAHMEVRAFPAGVLVLYWYASLSCLAPSSQPRTVSHSLIPYSHHSMVTILISLRSVSCCCSCLLLLLLLFLFLFVPMAPRPAVHVAHTAGRSKLCKLCKYSLAARETLPCPSRIRDRRSSRASEADHMQGNIIIFATRYRVSDQCRGMAALAPREIAATPAPKPTSKDMHMDMDEW